MVTITKEVEEVKMLVESKDLLKNNVKTHQTRLEISKLRDKLVHMSEKEDVMKHLVERLITSQKT